MSEHSNLTQNPPDPFKSMNLPQLENIFIQSYNSGRYVEAFRACCEQVIRNPDKVIHMLRLTVVANEVKITAFEPAVKKAIHLCLKTPGIDRQKFVVNWIDTVLSDPVHTHLAALFHCKSDEEFEEKMHWPAIKESLQDDFIVQGLRGLSLSGVRLEFLILRLRKWLLLTSRENKIFNLKLIPFLCALAECVNLSEYAYYVSPEEAELVEQITKQVESDEAEPADIALLGAYISLNTLSNAEDLYKNAKGEAMKDMLYFQVGAPREEQELKKTIQTIRPIKDDVSEKVQAMYEDNPYPRWRESNMRPAPSVGVDGDILIAGCGTGRPAVQIAKKFPDLKITAVDLSRSSLAYAQRKARENEAPNIEFIHGDILELSELGKKFDLIDCSGVLHHMKDPVAGFKQLIACTKEGGRLNIGLYSARAREKIIEARKYVEEKGFEPTADGIRAFRHHILNLPDDVPVKQIALRKDFYSLSECRDLVFHIQETNYVMPEIKQMLEDLNLSFLHFKFNSVQISRLYSKKFPEDPLMRNLDNWDKLELEHPNMFIGMYQFLCCRKGEEDKPNAIMETIESTGFLRA